LTAMRLAWPGLGWLPPTWRQSAYWRTVGRFVLWGPLIGGAPYVAFVVTVPFIYALGLGPALIAGLLFAAWWHAPSRRVPTWPWRLAVGASSGVAAALLCALLMGEDGRADLFTAAVAAWHGVPAAVVLALTQKRATSP